MKVTFTKSIYFTGVQVSFEQLSEREFNEIYDNLNTMDLAYREEEKKLPNCVYHNYIFSNSADEIILSMIYWREQ